MAINQNLLPLENQFVQITNGTFGAAQNKRPLPFAIPIHDGIELFLPRPAIQILLVDSNNQPIAQLQTQSITHINIFGDDTNNDGSAIFAQYEQDILIGQTFYIVILTEKNHPIFSQPLIRVPYKNYIHAKYSCNNYAFGFPFQPNENLYASFAIPVIMDKPQFVQNNKTYTTLAGENINLYANYYKEYQCHTDYLSEEYHQKIISLLSCDQVFFNNQKITKSENYQILWDNYDVDCITGRKKLAQATFKVRTDTRYSNNTYGALNLPE